MTQTEGHDSKAVLAELEALGTAQNRKVYARHGVGGPMYGVSFAKLDQLTRRIEQDHALALALWESGNHDARVLATKVADPAELGSRQLDAWARDLDSYVIADAFSALVARGPLARQKAEQWIARKGEYVGQTGWNVVAHLAMRPDEMPDRELGKLIAVLERNIHQAANRTRYAMNSALIAIGGSRPALEDRALAAARRIGEVEVDHGETGCRTPDAATYIAKMHQRRKEREKAHRRGR